jgi:hypothetical protein
MMSVLIRADPHRAVTRLTDTEAMVLDGSLRVHGTEYLFAELQRVLHLLETELDLARRDRALTHHEALIGKSTL